VHSCGNTGDQGAKVSRSASCETAAAERPLPEQEALARLGSTSGSRPRAPRGKRRKGETGRRLALGRIQGRGVTLAQFICAPSLADALGVSWAGLVAFVCVAQLKSRQGTPPATVGLIGTGAAQWRTVR